jgi:hypothetical protein
MNRQCNLINKQKAENGIWNTKENKDGQTFLEKSEDGDIGSRSHGQRVKIRD